MGEAKEVSAMRYLVDNVHIEASGQQVWEWLMHLAEHYLEWHPDHVSAEWVRGKPNRVGSILEVIESLDGHRERLRFELTRTDPPALYEYRIRGAIAALLPKGSFAIESDNTGCAFTAKIAYRLGALTEWLFRSRMRALQVHQEEEGLNLKRILERPS